MTLQYYPISPGNIQWYFGLVIILSSLCQHMVFLLTLFCLHVECLKLYFIRPSKSRKDPILKKEKKKKIFPYAESFSSFCLPRIFCYIFLFCFFSDYRISICLMSKKLRTQEWNEIEYQTLLNKTYQTGRMLGIWEIYIFINISNYVWYYVRF